MYKETIEQTKNVIQLGYIEELNSHYLNCENWEILTEMEKIEAYKFAVILFECIDKSNIWSYGVYC